MATRPGREKSLVEALKSLIGQADEINVYYNYKPEAPTEVNLLPGVKPVYAPEGDLGAKGKFYFARDFEGYYLTVDDDIRYPKGYVRHLVERIDYYDRRAIVGLHGTRYQPRRRMKSYWNDKQVRLFFFDALSTDSYVTMLGTGTMGFHTDTTRFDDRDLSQGWCVDPQVCKLKDKDRIPHISVCRPHAWAVQIPESQDGESVWIKHAENDNIQTRILNQATRAEYKLVRPDIKLSSLMP